MKTRNSHIRRDILRMAIALVAGMIISFAQPAFISGQEFNESPRITLGEPMTLVPIGIDENTVNGGAENIYLSNAPNPFSGKTVITFVVPSANIARLEVLDLTGRLIRILYNADVIKGQQYIVEFDGSALPSGLYIYKLVTGASVICNKMLIMN